MTVSRAETSSLSDKTEITETQGQSAPHHTLITLLPPHGHAATGMVPGRGRGQRVRMPMMGYKTGNACTLLKTNCWAMGIAIGIRIRAIRSAKRDRFRCSFLFEFEFGLCPPPPPDGNLL